MYNQQYNRKKIILLVIFLFSFYTTLHSQSTKDSLYWFVNSNGAAVQRKVDSLKKQGIDTTICFFSTVKGWPAYIDSAGVYEIQYLIWSHDSRTYFQKFVELNHSHYKNFNPVLILHYDFQQFLRTNLNTIRNEMIVPFIYKSTDSQNRTLYSPLYGTHMKYSFIRITTTETDIGKEIYDHDLEEERVGVKNLNYIYNYSTKLKSLYELILLLIGKIDWN